MRNLIFIIYEFTSNVSDYLTKILYYYSPGHADRGRIDKSRSNSLLTEIQHSVYGPE